MPDRFVVVEGVAVETGSFHRTEGGERSNAENVPALRDDPQVAGEYEAA